MISLESTTKDVKLVGYDFRGHTRGSFILSTTSEKLFIPYKTSAAVQALKVCSVRP